MYMIFLKLKKLENLIYQLQLQAPQPICIPPKHEIPNRPPQYDPKEFHGTLSRQEADILLQGGDGYYLVRKSERAPDSFTLAIRFDNETKNYKLYYDGQHFVGEKRFDSVYDLVADGLIHFFIELRAADYIKTLSQESNYEESPYMAFKGRYMTGNSSRTEGANGVASEVRIVQFPFSYQILSFQLEQCCASDTTEQANINDDEIKLYNCKKLCECFFVCSQVQNFVGHWCDFCANFMWGLIAQGVKCQDCGFQAHKRCSEKVPNDCMPDMKYVKRIFGGDLTTVVKAQKSLIPIVVEKCVKEIELRGMDQEGLYRLAGFHDDVEALRMAFDKEMNGLNARFMRLFKCLQTDFVRVG
ncbi:hypothetical protein EGW08_016354 [Elysia chlorotica]|uniref:Phorbol-ester/DAG-type domain-containing protein n=1 Tax=Elysia chlorotica TaxID=188477 RepID=A0A3S0ZJ18_ELYCH|nr:hypothetical protein EGW08_016354 [Elysia chlorotica]